MTQVEGDDLIGSESNHHKLIKETQIPTSPLESHEKTFNPTTYDCDFISIQRRNIIPIKLQLLPNTVFWQYKLEDFQIQVFRVFQFVFSPEGEY